MSKKTISVLAVIVLVLIIDQWLKIHIKLNFKIEQFTQFLPFIDTEKGRLLFVENEGMAFGWLVGGKKGKLVLSLLRLVAIGFLINIIRKLIQGGATTGMLLSLGLILAGAIGNILDSAFYGIIFSESTYHSVAEFMPEEGGYAPFLFGKVVDMFHFPLFSGNYPSWIPIIGGDAFTFFSFIFNVADAAISVGLVFILISLKNYIAQYNRIMETDIR